jgi:hypothetical protein
MNVLKNYVLLYIEFKQIQHKTKVYQYLHFIAEMREKEFSAIAMQKKMLVELKKQQLKFSLTEALRYRIRQLMMI